MPKIYQFGYYLLLGVYFFYKLYISSKSFNEYIEESNKPSNIYQCLNENCLKRSFLKNEPLNAKKLLIINPVNSCKKCDELFSKELEPSLYSDHIKWEVMSRTDTNLHDIFKSNHFQFEHITLVALDRYNVHYVYEYHPTFPFKESKTNALFTFLQQSL